MAISARTHVGPYEIISSLGVGGMGEVYRARDAHLNRDVAIKVLLPAVANDPERLLLFRREAHVLASLNHPNIAHLYGFEDLPSAPALVMELVEGPTLADRIAQGALPTEDALPIAKQVAEAIEAVLFDRKGGAEALKLPPGRYEYPRVSPDGKRIAFGTDDGKEAAVSIYELSGASSVRRLTFGGNNRFPIWSSDGRHVAFQSDRNGDHAVFWQLADGGTAEPLTTPDRGTSHTPESWSPDGEVLLFSVTKDFVSSLWTLSVRDRKVAPFGTVQGSSLPTDAIFSPDGQWVAYQVGQAGGAEGTTFVEPFPPTGTKFEVARGGRPLWSRDGKELFVVPSPASFMVVAVRRKPSLTFTPPVAVPRGFGAAPPPAARTFDIMPDGRIIGVGMPGQTSGGSDPNQIQVVLNWFEELKARAPSSRR